MTAATITELNALRTAAGMKPLKAWKESKDKLTAAVNKLRGAATTTQQLKASAEVAVKKDAKKSAAKPKVKTTKPAVEGVSIKAIAKKLGIDDKVARAKLRRQDDVPCIEGSRWVFAQKDVAAIEAILKNDARKK